MIIILKEKDKVAIISCSNPYSNSNKPKIDSIINLLNSFKLNVVASPYLFEGNSSPKHRGEIFMRFMMDEEIKVIFDISGGDLCNEILDYIDFTILKDNKTLYCGYSDNSVLINALYTKSNISSMNYQITRLIGSDSINQLKFFRETFLNVDNSLVNFSYKWLSKKEMSGVVLGGNLRCTLKLAGTDYFPNLENSILFLESLSGDDKKVLSSFTQYKHIGAFSKAKGIILGEFTELETSSGSNAPFELLKKVIDTSNIPVIKTQELGHSSNSKGIFIGKYREFK